MSFTRRFFLNFISRAAAVAAAQSLLLKGQQNMDPRMGNAGAEKLFRYYQPRSTVSLVRGDSRRKNVYNALVAIDEQIRPGLRRKKYVIIKPNGLNPRRVLASTHLDAVHGVLDYLASRYKGQVVIAETGNLPARQAWEEYNWKALAAEHKPIDFKLNVLNEDGRYELVHGIDFDLHPIPIRLGAQLLDPNAFVISVAPMKSHNMVVATLSVKNVILGAPLTSPPGARRPSGQPFAGSDKRKYHVGIRQGNYNMMLTAQKMIPNWGLAVIDGFEGMEGNGPVMGTPVDHRIAVASTDWIAADRVGVECMGIDAGWPGYLNYCYQMGLGQWDLSKIDVRGPKIEEVQKKYRLNADIDRMLQWRGPMEDLPVNLG